MNKVIPNFTPNNKVPIIINSFENLLNFLNIYKLSCSSIHSCIKFYCEITEKNMFLECYLFEEKIFNNFRKKKL